MQRFKIDVTNTLLREEIRNTDDSTANALQEEELRRSLKLVAQRQNERGAASLDKILPLKKSNAFFLL